MMTGRERGTRPLEPREVAACFDDVAVDPWWGLEGTGAKRTRRRVLVESVFAVAMAIVACGLVTAIWLRELAPLAHQLGLT